MTALYDRRSDLQKALEEEPENSHASSWLIELDGINKKLRQYELSGRLDLSATQGTEPVSPQEAEVSNLPTFQSPPSSLISPISFTYTGSSGSEPGPSLQDEVGSLTDKQVSVDQVIKEWNIDDGFLPNQSKPNQTKKSLKKVAKEAKEAVKKAGEAAIQLDEIMQISTEQLQQMLTLKSASHASSRSLEPKERIL